MLTSKFLNCGYDDWIKLPRSSHHATKELARDTVRRETRKRVSGSHMVRWERLCTWIYARGQLSVPDRRVAEMNE